MSSADLYTMTIAAPGWTEKREIRVGSVSASWRISGAGRLSAAVSVRDYWLLGLGEPLGRHVFWAHPTMGPWGGIVEDIAINMDAGTLELSCASFDSALKDRRTAKSQRPSSGPPGSLVLKAFADISVNDLPFDDVQADTSGDPVTMHWRADDLYSVVTRLASGGGMMFDTTIDPDDLTITFQFRTQTGSDKSGDILLREGYQIADGTIARSRANLVNDILAVSAEQEWDDAMSIATLDADSIQAYGRKQRTVRYYGFSSRQALRTRARIDLDLYAEPQIPVSFRLSDRTPELAEIRQGDTIRVHSASANAEYLVDVVGRSVNVDNGSVTITGDARAVAA